MKIIKEKQKLWQLLGDLPEKSKISVTTLFEREMETYIVEELLLSINSREDVPAYFVKPKNKTKKRPTVLFNHSHGGLYDMGKKELLKSSPYLYEEAFAKTLTDLGYNVLCLDMWGFGERAGKAQTEIFKEMLWNGEFLWGMMIYDSIRGIDYLFEREDVDSTRIATMGMSMGGLMAWWIAALDERISVCIDITAQAEARTLVKQRRLDSHGFYSYVPGLLKHFETAEIQSFIAPRPHLSLVGEHDLLTPYDGLSIIDEELKKIYEEMGIAHHWKMSRYPCGHIETAGMRAEACDFLKTYL
ncbi:dienelactone hydrolase family protein [Priestia endophytica]|uniref:dienelactone hydrolase family protein n=1 Tax=Priestia endophytica TaxID=135735 RepID=UPI000DCA4C83|nr:alpha/beta fold hydrolase [Priestia endophytica]RAS86553.1 hydrolase [Priestia endophytica]